ncbi:unnamed protein product [Calypogeia fissa]
MKLRQQQKGKQKVTQEVEVETVEEEGVGVIKWGWEESLMCRPPAKKVLRWIERLCKHKWWLLVLMSPGRLEDTYYC